VDYLINLVGALTTLSVVEILCVRELPLIGVITPLTLQVPLQEIVKFTP
jgi:hypothetical protein